MPSLTELNIIEFDSRRQGIYVNFDSLFDTKLACLEEVNVDLAIHAIANGWSERIWDTVPGFPDDKLKELYDARDVRTLLLAHPTMITDFINQWIKQLHLKAAGNPFTGYCELFINVWPFKMPKQIANRICKTVVDLLDSPVRTTILNIDPQDISALDVKRFFSAMIDVDYGRFLNARCATDLKDCPLPDTVLYAPKIFRGELDSATRNQVRNVDVFVQAEQMLAPMIRLEFLDLEFFSSPVKADMLGIKPLAEIKAT